MIAVDANVLLRHLLGDEPQQSERARTLFERAESVLVSDIVLAETIWTLKGKRYRATNEDVGEMVLALLAEPNVAFESREAVWSAVDEFLAIVRDAGVTVPPDLTDALIVNKSRVVARARGERYDGTFTFDRAALALQGTKRA